MLSSCYFLHYQWYLQTGLAIQSLRRIWCTPDVTGLCLSFCRVSGKKAFLHTSRQLRKLLQSLPAFWDSKITESCAKIVTRTLWYLIQKLWKINQLIFTQNNIPLGLLRLL